MNHLLQIFFVLLLISSCQPIERTELLREQIENILSEKQVVVGIALIGPDGQDTLSINGDFRLPMQSVFKYHIAVAVLAEVDKGHLSLEQTIDLPAKELLPSYWSPMRDEHPKGGKISIADLIRYSVSQSDNVACDLLIDLIGNAKTVESYMKNHGIADIAIVYNEADMQAEWDRMFDNWITAKAASQSLQLFYENKNALLSESSHAFLWKTMRETSTGMNRIKGLLPGGTVVAHKTGTAATAEDGLTPATNDIGIVFLPDGKYFLLSVLVSNSRESAETNEKIIADIAALIYRYYTNLSK